MKCGLQYNKTKPKVMIIESTEQETTNLEPETLQDMKWTIIYVSSVLMNKDGYKEEMCQRLTMK